MNVCQEYEGKKAVGNQTNTAQLVEMGYSFMFSHTTGRRYSRTG